MTDFESISRDAVASSSSSKAGGDYFPEFRQERFRPPATNGRSRSKPLLVRPTSPQRQKAAKAFKRVTVLGAGYVGLVSGAGLSQLGHSVTCVDTDGTKVAALRQGQSTIFEPGLDELLERNVGAGRLAFTTNPSIMGESSDVIVIAVGTPSDADGRADLSQVYAAAAAIRLPASSFVVVVVKSTVPVGTGDEVERIVRENNPQADFEVVSSPEFLREGSAVGDFFRPDRIVVGTESVRAGEVMSELYAGLPSGTAIFFTTRRTSELIKYSANAFLAMKISFINEMADLSEAAGVNVQELATGLGLDKRIGDKFLQAGPGYGGSCFPKDTRALSAMGRDWGTPLRLVEATIAANDDRKRRMAERVKAACGGEIAGKTVALLGLTFKAATDDMRDAPSLDIARDLLAAGAHVRAFDPKGMETAQQLLPALALASTAIDAVRSADAVVVVTEWDEFRALDLWSLRAAMRQPIMVDLRNIYLPEEARAAGFAYSSIGRP
jgi:UDPglucose 6-dehydrogenase